MNTYFDPESEMIATDTACEETPLGIDGSGELEDTEPLEEEEDCGDDPDDSMDGDAESALASAGHGMDEDYNFNAQFEEWQGDSDGSVGCD